MILFRRIKVRDSGQAMVEYALTLALVAMLVIGALGSIGFKVSDIFDKVVGAENNKPGNVVAKQGNYILHYGTFNREGIENAKRYDMIILEPLNVKDQEIKELEDSGTVTYGYQSPLAVEKVNKAKVARMREDDYLYLNGEKRKSKHFGYYYGDIRSEHYQEILMEFIEKDILNKGISGVFYDTIEDIEGFKDENGRTDRALQAELYEGYLNFFKKLETKYPDLSIIQNRALKFYINGSAKHIDAMMYENLNYQNYENSETGPYYHNLKASLVEAEKNSNSVIMAMSYQEPEKNYQFSKQEGWIYLYHVSNPYLARQDVIYSVNKK